MDPLDIRDRVSVGEAVAAGALAWLALNIFAHAAAPLFGVSFGVTTRFFASLLFPGTGAAAQLWIGRAIFLGAALGWSLVYRRIQDRLPGPAWLRGLIFGTGIWVASALALPLLGAIHPALGGFFPARPDMMRGAYPGLFGVGFRGGPGIALSVLAHQVFGVTLGMLTRVKAPRANPAADS